MNSDKTSPNSRQAAQLAALDHLNVPALIANTRGILTYANKAARHLLNTATDMQQSLDGNVLQCRLCEQQQAELIRACQSGESCRLNLQLSAPDSEHPDRHRRLQLAIAPLPLEQQSESLVQITLKDISRYQDLSLYEAAHQLPVHFHQAMQQTEDMVMVTDSKGCIEYVNPAFIHQTGYSANEVIGNNPRLLSSDEHDSDFYRNMWQTLSTGRSYRNIFINRRRNGERYHEEKTITPIRDEQGEISHFVATGRDITDLIHSKQDLNYLRRFDTLTGLPNRQRLAEQLEQHVSQRPTKPMALLMVDLDRLSRINDSHGRTCGDELLQETANRLDKALPAHFVGRLGSDAFMVLAEGIETPDQAAHLAQKIRQVIGQPFRLRQSELFISASLGITLYPTDGQDFDELVNKADSAMHRCKENDQPFGFFTEDLTQQTQQRVRLENQLRQALLHKEFHLVFQPRVSLAAGRINSVEVLLRWITKEGTSVPPDVFIPILEEMGLITSVGEWVLMRACVYAAQWQENGDPIRISVNLSARQLRQPNLCDIVNRCLSVSGLAPERLELELTETSMLEDVEHSIHQLSQLRAQGVRVAIDDFGTGYSSLAYLKKLPADTLKIDRAFIHELENQDETDLNIVRAIIQLAHNLQLSVTAEGIETARQLDLISQLGCDEAQGYLLSRPLPEAELMKIRRNFNRLWSTGFS